MTTGKLYFNPNTKNYTIKSNEMNVRIGRSIKQVCRIDLNNRKWVLGGFGEERTENGLVIRYRNARRIEA